MGRPGPSVKPEFARCKRQPAPWVQTQRFKKRLPPESNMAETSLPSLIIEYHAGRTKSTLGVPQWRFRRVGGQALKTEVCARLGRGPHSPRGLGTPEGGDRASSRCAIAGRIPLLGVDLPL